MNGKERKNLIKVLYMLIVFMCLLIVAGLLIKTMKVVSDYRQKAKAQEEKEYRENLEYLYERETYAFCMGAYNEYHDFSSVNIRRLIISLELYGEKQPSAKTVTVDDVQSFLLSEYGENGELRVLNPPENISDYINWFCYEGAVSLDKYMSILSQYSYNHPEKYNSTFIYNMDLDMLNELINDYKNCPNKEDYED